MGSKSGIQTSTRAMVTLSNLLNLFRWRETERKYKILYLYSNVLESKLRTFDPATAVAVIRGNRYIYIRYTPRDRRDVACRRTHQLVLYAKAASTEGSSATRRSGDIVHGYRYRYAITIIDRGMEDAD